MRKSNFIFISLTVLAIFISSCSAASPESLEFYPEAPPEPAFDTGVSGRSSESIAFEGEEALFFGDDETNAGSERVVIRNANLRLVVDDPGVTMSEIAKMANDMGGFVVSSNLYQTQLESGLEVPRASITIRVPSERLTEALDQLEASANQVLSRDESGQDVTQEYTDLQSRLRNAQDAEVKLREIMASANKTEDVLSVFNQLTRVTEEIEVLKGRIQFFEQSAAFSAISVDLVANEAIQPLTIGGWQPVGVTKDAIQTLINTLKFLANAAIWIVLYILPTLIILLLPVVLVWRGVRRWRSRRRGAGQPPPPRTPPSET